MNNQITHWDPFRDMDEIQNRLASLWNRGIHRANGDKKEALTATDWNPRVDIVEEEKSFLIKAELPEMKREDIKVNVEDGVLTLSGERKLEVEKKDKKYHRIEREYGSFRRSFSLPTGTAGDMITADFKDGILKVNLPKDAMATPQSVDIKIS